MPESVLIVLQWDIFYRLIRSTAGGYIFSLFVSPQGEGVPCSLVPGLWFQVLFPGKRGYPSLWSQVSSGRPGGRAGGTQVRTSTWVPPSPQPLPKPGPGQGTPLPPDTTLHGQDVPRAVRLLRSRRRTF